MILFMIVIQILILEFIYNRYIPVRGVQCFNTLNADAIIVDVRDYHQSYKDPLRTAINIPIAYLKRNYHEISSSKVYVVASDHLEKNMSIRFLRKKGFEVLGYTLTDCRCNPDRKEKQQHRKENIYGMQ
ncbi:rhodanese-like domain-containing protein [Bacillus changyiensis]|uniref:hypothetical protein n=1 Tax=Bacillus changyiensis TaxID=3004103 RepID=UPI0022E0BC9C|nr:hypothetical protein [Bacillus changyiensis]MDA1477631.1 hypothetical protein [Bacillus changyiensis]